MGALPTLTVLKLALTLAGLILFVISLRTGEETYRWAAVALLAVSFVLRFVGRRRPPEG